jgi:DnaJ-class molecular chaperone
MYDKKPATQVNSLKDYYAILQLPFEAKEEQIKIAYFKMNEKHSPDAPQEGLSKEELDDRARSFRDVQEAYQVLSNPEKRRQYDKTVIQRQKQSGDVRAIWAKLSSTHSHQAMTNTIPVEAAPKPSMMQAQAYEVQAEITLREAVKGTRYSITIGDPTPCEDCAEMKPLNRMQCLTCRGVGHFVVSREEEVILPAGLQDGTEIRKAELGKYDLRAQRNGDLVVKIKIKEHPQLTLIGKDIQCTVPLTIYEAMLGSEIEIPTATGRVVMKTQPLTHPGRVYRLKGLGLADGDQLVKIEVVIPQKISAEEVTMFKKMRDMHKDLAPRSNMFDR